KGSIRFLHLVTKFLTTVHTVRSRDQSTKSPPSTRRSLSPASNMGDTSTTCETRKHFRRLQNFKPDYAAAEITQYESERTGMRVAVCDRQSPKVHGYFALATEIHDDSGAPHTLEHLIFMGSKSYKYKGVLDKLATRGYSFTNAWTATDHTAYT